MPPKSVVVLAPKHVAQQIEVFPKDDPSFSSVQGGTGGSGCDAEVLRNTKAPGCREGGVEDSSTSEKNDFGFASLEDCLTPLLVFMAAVFGFPVYPVAKDTGTAVSLSESPPASYTGVDGSQQPRTCFSVPPQNQDSVHGNNSQKAKKFDQHASATEITCRVSSLRCFEKSPLSNDTWWRWWRRCSFCVVISLQVFNVGRSLAAFRDTTVPIFRWVTSISYQVCY